MLSPIVAATLTENTDRERRTDFLATLNQTPVGLRQDYACWGEALNLGRLMVVAIIDQSMKIQLSQGSRGA